MSEMEGAAKIMGSTSVSNETVTLTQSGALATGYLSQAGLFTGASAIRNASVSEGVITLGTLPAHNASIVDGLVTVNASVVNTTSVRVDYSHYTPSAAYNSTGSIITKLATVPTWIGIIIIVALAFIVLSFFIGKRQ